MIFISHRGNTDGKVTDRENTEDYILEAISMGYDVEIDAWLVGCDLYLGHDAPIHHTDLSFLSKHCDKLWIHCKNIPALHHLVALEELNVFFHDTDDVVLTSKKYLWTYPGKNIDTDKSVCVLPEISEYETINCHGICSDYIKKYYDEYGQSI